MDNDLNREVGRIAGKQEALEARVDRNEKAVWSKLDGMDIKLDNIAVTLSGSNGEKRGSIRLLHWLVTAFGMAMAWWGGHSGVAR